MAPVDLVENLEKLLSAGQDGAVLRFGLGNAYLQQGHPEQAVKHLQSALQQDPGYSAAWKHLGKAYAELGRIEEAMDSYRRGMQVAETKGDQQSAREMGVFLRRLEGREKR